MLRPLLLGFLTSVFAIAQLPSNAQVGSAEDLRDVMSISLEDVVKPTFGFQGALQGAGTPNHAGIGGFLPLSVAENSVWFLDALANVNFSDRNGDSSIINTDVVGTTISTSTRLGYRWLNNDRSWMFGVNTGYDSRPMNTGGDDTNINIYGTEKSAFFQQVALNAEAVSSNWNLSTYALVPIGDTEQSLNWYYRGGALDTYGLDVGYRVTPQINLSAGYYYQLGDLGTADGSGALGRLAYDISSGIIAGITVSYDEAFETRVMADIALRFGTYTDSTSVASENSVITALTSSPGNRSVRVHDTTITVDQCWEYESDGITLETNMITCIDTSTGYEDAEAAEYTKDEAYDSCVKKAGAFSYDETVKTSLTDGETVKYTYYCQVNS